MRAPQHKQASNDELRGIVVVRISLEQALPDTKREEIANTWNGDCRQWGQDSQKLERVADNIWESEQLGGDCKYLRLVTENSWDADSVF